MSSDRSVGLVAWWHRVAGHFSRRDLFEALLVAGGFLAYFAVRGAVVDRPEAAYFNALEIIDLQRRLGFFWEDDLHRWAIQDLFVVQTFNIIYFWLHFPLIIAFGIWCYYFRRERYTLLRDAFLASGALALIVYWVHPVAPPRLLPELAAQFDPSPPPYVAQFVDTMQVYLGYAYQTQETTAFVNPYAAMPSLHFGWDLLLGMGIIWVFWETPLRWLAVPVGIFLPASQVFAITITANHYFLDAAAGAAVSLLGIPVALGMRRLAYPWLGSMVARLPWPSLRRLLLPGPPAPTASKRGR
jgi:hypothetical protein